MRNLDRQLVLISGGGFSTETEAYIDSFALNLCPKKEKKTLVFIPTASHDAINYIEKFHHTFREHDTYHLTKDELKNVELLETADLIYIGGGNTHYMLDTWRETGFDQRLIKMYEKGKVIVGISAGAVCWFTDVFENNQSFKGLGILKGSLCPHYESNEKESILYNEWESQSSDIIHYKLSNNENLHIINERIISKITVL
ncbi:Type 1 glutamine amidotransferase-like domain-containing protein [Vagococcus hydrophili]|uniref:Type 1 glutamine amidotransferase-like domain-containing protein n=1 Tax=Vagococcus hydrophili TaxID=2714947 RepID=A0A6G8AVT3_9ENTE|nr:peptidase E [Vagococcus hydrophili]QIL49178.1 type 1 glutamine amidotransferase-like domain-containing protein [Vagococcus hydrophili]